MRGQIEKLAAIGVLGSALACPSGAWAQSAAPEAIFTDGKIVTVDEQFRIAEAIAIRGDRIVAVGTAADIGALAGPATDTVDLGGRTVVPGLIDNHMHLLRAGTTWLGDVRLDGIESRDEALDLLRARAVSIPAGEWVFTLGGWMPDQFAADSRPFTRDELDAAIPNHPVLLQSAYYRSYVNSLALDVLDLDKNGRGEPWVVRDANGRPTGEIGQAGVRPVASMLPTPSREEIETGTAAMIGDLNAMGLTAIGAVGCPEDLLDLYRGWASRDELNLRVLCMDGLGADTPEDVDAILPHIADLELFQGDDMVDRVLYGEGIYNPLHDSPYLADVAPTQDQLLQWRRIVTEIAKAGLPLQVHVHHRVTLDAFLDELGRVHAEHPIRNLRWAFAHGNQLDATHLERMKALGMYAAVHPWMITNGAVLHEISGDAAYDFMALRTIEDSGITWGFGSDGTRVNLVAPLETLAWAVTGEMIGGRKVTRQTITREEALIAHTRKNAYLIFREDDLGSIEPGKLADFVVLDRDYLTVPANEIRAIRPVMTVVDGRIVYGAGL